MKEIIGGFIAFVGVAWVAVLGLMALLEMLFGGPRANPMQFVYTMVVGVILVLIGLPLFFMGRRQNNQYLAAKKSILDKGVPARGRVTFVDKNYSVLVNQKPIYSSVEYTFEDHLGRPHIGRSDAVDSDWVIRAQIAVGSEVELKYLANDPEQNQLVLPGEGK